jgi:hypothetical protein
MQRVAIPPLSPSLSRMFPPGLTRCMHKCVVMQSCVARDYCRTVSSYCEDIQCKHGSLDIRGSVTHAWTLYVILKSIEKYSNTLEKKIY